MLFPKLARLLFSLAIMTLLAVSCGADATIDAGSETAVADASTSSSDTAEPTAVPPTAAPEPTTVAPTAAPEPTASAAETEGTTGGDPDATGTSDDNDVVVIEDRDDAVAYFTSEGLIARDAECLADGAYQVFGTWDFVELDPDPDQDEALDKILDVCITVVPGPAEGSPPPGTNAELDELWISCAGGSAEACDDLFWQAPVDSDYEAFGLSCGGRAIDECSDVLGD